MLNHLTPADVYDLADDARTGLGGRESSRLDLANLLERVAEEMEQTGDDWHTALCGFSDDDNYQTAYRILYGTRGS